MFGIERLPGFRDFLPGVGVLPGSMEVRNFVLSQWRKTALGYGFREYDGPPLESLELYTRKSGAEIVNQLYCFTDKGGREVALRPEMTPTLARLISRNQRHYKKPLKWFSLPQLFRYEKQQKGRLREHFQLNADIVGEPGPGADAELIALLIDSLRACGLGAEDVVVRLSSRLAWQGFFEEQCADPSLAYAFFQIVDKLEREPRDVSASRLERIGIRLEEVQAFIGRPRLTPALQSIVANLTSRGLQDYVEIDYGVIRGLAYYTGVVFEAFDRKGALRAIAGGGRYDQLIERISGGKVDLPALGFGMGDVVLTELLMQRDSLHLAAEPLDAYCLIETEDLREATLALVQTLREAGKKVDYPLATLSGNKQFKHALELGARYCVRIEGSGEGRSWAVLKDMKSRGQSRVALSALPRALV